MHVIWKKKQYNNYLRDCNFARGTNISRKRIESSLSMVLYNCKPNYRNSFWQMLLYFL